MARGDLELRSAKNAYKEAVAMGNRREEARWANVIGDILKRRGEYVQALRWLRIDYDVSVKHLPERHMLPTCQSLGEVFLRLERFDEALVYQRRHLELAKKADDLIEQQRASTQLGRTYHEIFLRSEKDHDSLRYAKKYFRSSFELARDLRKSHSYRQSCFLKELIDSYNNLGLFEMDLDNLDEAKRILIEGLEICDVEEVKDDDDGRSRLHHNLGRLYMELRMWDKAKNHTEKDILICRRIGHAEGEAKGFINLGELQNRVQKYDEAMVCYQKALKIAKSMEDEDALVQLINENINAVKGAMEELDKLKKEEQNLKKLTRNAVVAKGTEGERIMLLHQCSSLDRLIEASSLLRSWIKHWEFAKRKKRVAKELCDKEKLADSFLAIGEAYQNLRNFTKACKWYTRSMEMYTSITHLRGQALAKINIGTALDSVGDWGGALEAFEEGYRIAVEGNLLDEQILALDNMHYCHMIRFDNVEKARKLQVDIDNLKKLLEDEGQFDIPMSERFPETETAGCFPDPESGEDVSSKQTRAISSTSNKHEEIMDNLTLSSFLNCQKKYSGCRTEQLDLYSNRASIPTFRVENISTEANQSTHIQAARKRTRVVISDDEDSECEEGSPQEHAHLSSDFTPYGTRRGQHDVSGNHKTSSDPYGQRDAHSECESFHLEATSSFKSDNCRSASGNGIKCALMDDCKTTSSVAFVSIGSMSRNELSDQNGEQFDVARTIDGDSFMVTCKVDDLMISADLSSCVDCNSLNIDKMKVELACLYYLKLPKEKYSRGMLPILHLLKWNERPLKSLEPVEKFKSHHCEKGCMEAVVNGWIHKRLMKLYIDNCSKISQSPSMRLLRKLYNLEVSEDEVIVSDCELEDLSISPLLDALCNYPVTVLDLSHNLLGNETMKKLKEVFASTTHVYGGLTFDLHCNRFGATALFQICECPVLFNRLEVLNLSENRLTDGCASYISLILKNCRALYSLYLEKCSITSRTVQTIADSLDLSSNMSHLALGKNSPISGSIMAYLLQKLSSLKRFSELNLTGVKLGGPMIHSLCQFVKTTPNLRALLIGGTFLGSVGAVQLAEALSNASLEFEKLDISHCGMNSNDMMHICASIASMSILELNMSGNSIEGKGIDAITSLLTSPQCSLRVLFLDNCHLGVNEILHLIETLSGNNSLEELSLSHNVKSNVAIVTTTNIGDITNWRNQDNPAISSEERTSMETETGHRKLEVPESDFTGHEIPDSEDEEVRECLRDDSSASSCRRPQLNSVLPNGSEIASSRHELAYFTDLAKAINNAKQLQWLDLSGNGFPPDAVEELYSSWSSASRTSFSTLRHTEHQIVHFSVLGKQCCGVKACCKKDNY